MRVLVVDDDSDTLDLFSTLLSTWGHEALTLEDPTRALATALKFLPDIIFLDLGMPALDGWEVARQIRKHTILDRSFLVAVTGYGRDEDWAQSQAAGFDVHLLKPVDMNHLKLLLRKRPYPAPRIQNRVGPLQPAPEVAAKLFTSPQPLIELSEVPDGISFAHLLRRGN